MLLFYLRWHDVCKHKTHYSNMYGNKNLQAVLMEHKQWLRHRQAVLYPSHNWELWFHQTAYTSHSAKITTVSSVCCHMIILVNYNVFRLAGSMEMICTVSHFSNLYIQKKKFIEYSAVTSSLGTLHIFIIWPSQFPLWIQKCTVNLNNILTHTQHYLCNKQFLCNVPMHRVFNLKVNRILIQVIYLLQFTTCYITQLTWIYSKCWKWCPFISMHLSTCFTMFLATFLSVPSFLIIFAIALFTGTCLPNFSKKLCLQWT